MDLFDIAAKISLNTKDFENGLQGANEQGETFADKLKSGLGTAAKVGGAALGAAATGISTLIGNSIKEYADYEQLVGGVETLFKQSAGSVQQYASEAYKTAGLSANEYMATVTSFSASLLQSLGGDTQAAAEYANQAIIDMADNANKMGSSMESIQAAYQGFAKQNYTMLDNLKLGYGGTKEEMIRLVEDAQRIDETFKANTETVVKNKKEVEELAPTYADIVQAIHIVQTEMGITGTTALEASETISGSVASMKSAWKNLVTGISDENANLENLIDNFVESVSTAAKNIIPRISQALQGAGTLIKELAPVIADALPGLITDVLPVLLESAGSLITSFGGALMENLPFIADSALNIIMTLVESLTEPGALEGFVNSAFTIIGQIVTSIGQALPTLIPAAVEIILQIAMSLLDNIDLLIDAAIQLIMGLAEGLISAIPVLVSKAPQIIEKLFSAIISAAPKLLEAGIQLIGKLWEGIKTLWSSIKEWGGQIIDQVWSGLSNAISSAVQWGADLITNFWNGIKSKLSWLWDGVKGIAGGIADFLGFSEPKKGPLSNFHTFAPDMMELFMKGINDNKDKLTDTVANAFDFRDAMTGPEYNGGFAFAGAGGGFSNGMPTIDLLIDGKTLVGSTREHTDRSMGEMDEIRARWAGEQK